MPSVIEKRAEEIMNTTLRKYRRDCPVNITDLVFLEIEKYYLDEYEKAMQYKDQETINRVIGKTIREYWGLKNLGRNHYPKSRLIKSYEEHAN